MAAPWNFILFLVVIFIPVTLTIHLSDTTKEDLTNSSFSSNVYFQDGDIILGGIFPLHTYDEKTRECSAIREIRALKLVEAMAYAVGRINNSTSLLPGLQLGFEIYDSCYSDIWTLKMALNFMPPEQKRACNGGLRQGETPVITCLHQKRIAGVVGSQRSASSAELAILLGLYQIPQVSYLSTLDSLGEVAYPYFLRVVPSDRYQVNAILDFVLFYEWTYISLLYSEDEYGENGYYEFTRQTAERGICLAYTRLISPSYTEQYYDHIIADLRRDPYSRAKAIVLFAHLAEARLFLDAIQRNGAVGEFTFVASDGIGNFGVQGLADVVEPAMGMITMVPYSERLPEFVEYFIQSWNEDSPNPWTKEYMERYTWCDVVNNWMCANNSTDWPSPHETLVIDSVYAFAYGLDTMLKAECGDVANLSTCALVKDMDGVKLLSHLKNTSFESLSNGRVFFDERGDGSVRYKIRNLNDALGAPNFVDVGSWRGTKMVDINRFLIRFYTNETTGWFGQAPRSVCSLPCPTGTKKEFFKEDSKCCWRCLECPVNSIVTDDDTDCVECVPPRWPDVNRTECVSVESSHMTWNTVEGAIVNMLALVASLEAILLFPLYVSQFRRRIVRGSDPMLCVFIFIGLCLLIVGGLSTTFKPSRATCAFARSAPPIAFALIFVPFAHKSARLYRVFIKARATGSEEEANLWGLKRQLLLVLSGWFIVIGVNLTWILIYPPDINYYFRPLDQPTEGGLSVTLLVTCNFQLQEIVTEMCFGMVLLFVTLVLSLLARTLPDNYHEASFCVFASAGSLLVFIGSFAASFGTAESTGLSYGPIMYRALGMITNAVLIMTCLFLPKIYVIYLVRGDIDEVMLKKRQSIAVSVYRARTSTATSIPGINGGGVEWRRPRARSSRSISEPIPSSSGDHGVELKKISPTVN